MSAGAWPRAIDVSRTDEFVFADPNLRTANRAQVFDPTLFTNLGIPATELEVLAVKSTNHFYRGFSAISSDIL